LQNGISRHGKALLRLLDAKPGAVAKPMAAPRTATPRVLLYKVVGKMFAIVSLHGDESVILKCDPPLADILRAQYAGIGHKSHLDRRNWICVTLGADVPAKEIKRLVAHSYELVCAGLTRKQRALLAASAPPRRRARRATTAASRR
jgi:predicted DNA-binding protein (MmcQ/YjbR family)